jgi:sugar lactone lactonase YvrE
MLSLVFGDSQPVLAAWRVTWALVLLTGAVACGGDDGGDDAPVVLADSGSFTAVTGNTFSIPTAVAVRDNIAWVVESQFDHYAPFIPASLPRPTPAAPFRLVGVPLPGSAETAVKSIALPADFFPESITVNSGGRMYVGSVANGGIYTVNPGAEEAAEFVPPGTLAKSAVLGMAVNGDNGLLWVCNNDVAASPVVSDIVGIGAGDRQVKASHPLAASPVGAFCNDIVIAPNGTLWATESFGGRIFRIPPGELLSNTPATAWLQATELAGPEGPSSAFGVNGIALVSGKLFLVNSSRGQLLSIDPTLAQPTSADLKVVALSEAGTPGKLLVTPDGITPVGNTDLLVVENGFLDANGGGKRLARITLDTL